MADKENGGDAKLEELQKALDETKAALKAANAEAAERRLKLKEKEAAEAEKLTENEKLLKRLSELEAKDQRMEAERKQRTIDDAIVAAAEELGFEFPKDAKSLIDVSKVEVTEDGKIKGFEAQLGELAKSNRLPMKGQVPQKRGSLVLNRQKLAAGTDQKNEPAIPPALTHI